LLVQLAYILMELNYRGIALRTHDFAKQI
jgi:hypothetical protein